MAGDEKWGDIYSKPLPDAIKPVSPLATPRVSRPQCGEHCSGRHEIEGVMQCPHCRVTAYAVVAHEWAWSDGHFFYTLEPRNGAPEHDARKGTPVCTCGREMQRVLG